MQLQRLDITVDVIEGPCAPDLRQGHLVPSLLSLVEAVEYSHGFAIVVAHSAWTVGVVLKDDHPLFHVVVVKVHLLSTGLNTEEKSTAQNHRYTARKAAPYSSVRWWQC